MVQFRLDLGSCTRGHGSCHTPDVACCFPSLGRRNTACRLSTATTGTTSQARALDGYIVWGCLELKCKFWVILLLNLSLALFRRQHAKRSSPHHLWVSFVRSCRPGAVDGQYRHGQIGPHRHWL